MHKIYFEKRCLIICPPEEPAMTDPNAVLAGIGRAEDVHNFINMFEISESLNRIYIPSDNPLLP